MGDATRIGNSSVNSTEEERKEVEEKVIWIFQKCFSTYPKVARYAKSVKGTQLSWSWNNKSKKGSKLLIANFGHFTAGGAEKLGRDVRVVAV